MKEKELIEKVALCLNEHGYKITYPWGETDYSGMEESIPELTKDLKNIFKKYFNEKPNN